MGVSSGLFTAADHQKYKTMRKRISEIKSETREFMVNRYYSFTPMLLLYFILELLAGLLPLQLFSGSDLVSGISLSVTSFIMNVLLGLAGVGLIKASIDCAKGEGFTVKTLFYAFSNRSNRFLIIQIIFTAIKTALSVPEIFLNRYAEENEMSVLSYYGCYGAILFGVLILTTLITIRLIWANYYLLENYNMNAGEALKKSLSFTKGRTMEVLLLKLSFLGFYILSYLSMMIGFIYVRPYSEVTYAKYFLKYNVSEEALS